MGDVCARCMFAYVYMSLFVCLCVWVRVYNCNVCGSAPPKFFLSFSFSCRCSLSLWSVAFMLVCVCAWMSLLVTICAYSLVPCLNQTFVWMYHWVTVWPYNFFLVALLFLLVFISLAFLFFLLFSDYNSLVFSIVCRNREGEDGN